MKRVLSVIMTVILMISCFTAFGCSEKQTEQSSDTITVTDMRGRTVTLKTDIKKVVCIGASALRLYSYVGDMTKLCGVESFEISKMTPLRVYAYAYKDLLETLPSCGAGGPNSSEDAEAILSCSPDVIFSLYSSVENMDKLQNDTGIPVICLSYGNSDPFSDKLKNSLTLIGKIMNDEKRAGEVVSYIESISDDLNKRTENVSDESKLKVYLGNNTYNGGKGSIGDTLTDYALFRELNANNVVNKENYDTSNPTLDLETVVSLNPDVIIIDAANISKFKEEYENNKDVFLSISAVKNGNVYVQMPFNQYYTNIEIALADSYYIGKVLYPEEFSDVDEAEKFNEICTFMLRVEKDYYSAITEKLGVGFSKLQNY